MYKRDFFGRLYETTTLYFIRLNEQKRNEVMFGQSSYKQLCMILTYVHVNVLSHSKHCVFVTSNRRMVKKTSSFITVFEFTTKRTKFLDPFKDIV